MDPVRRRTMVRAYSANIWIDTYPDQIATLVETGCYDNESFVVSGCLFGGNQHQAFGYRRSSAPRPACRLDSRMRGGDTKAMHRLWSVQALNSAMPILGRASSVALPNRTTCGLLNPGPTALRVGLSSGASSARAVAEDTTYLDLDDNNGRRPPAVFVAAVGDAVTLFSTRSPGAAHAQLQRSAASAWAGS
ncbi:hypothetical protein OPT61_g9999 [Boeremia exigua]|uniref:Uncharacterized protein n=1 Tax=Boeremia exigua TaxID=749465 RepID=A0ACC2HRN8_9PLEO|nr:hypothetical protein OPT61_g9999 [Boeremia exigua]